MKRFRFMFVLLILIILPLSFTVSCNRNVSDKGRIAFLSNYNISVDTDRPSYSTKCAIPDIFDSTWDIRSIFARDLLNIDISNFKGKECTIYGYYVLDMPPGIGTNDSSEARAVIILSGESIICGYVDFTAELGDIPPATLTGKPFSSISDVSWDIWRQRIDDDDYKSLVIWQYYDSLRMKDFDNAYFYLYDRQNIKEEEFIKAAEQNPLPIIDFKDMHQYKMPLDDECYFIVNVKVEESTKSYDITFDLKRDPEGKEFNGWKIYKTGIR